MSLWRKLAEGGGYSLPYLVKIAAPDGSGEICLINDSVKLEHGGRTYWPSQFEYTPADSGTGSFSIEIAEHDGIIDLLEGHYELNVEVTGVYNGEEVEEIASWRHRYGEATWDGKELHVELEADDRLEMTFPSLIFNSYNNRGNT